MVKNELCRRHERLLRLLESRGHRRLRYLLETKLLVATGAHSVRHGIALRGVKVRNVLQLASRVVFLRF